MKPAFYQCHVIWPDRAHRSALFLSLGVALLLITFSKAHIVYARRYGI